MFVLPTDDYVAEIHATYVLFFYFLTNQIYGFEIVLKRIYLDLNKIKYIVLKKDTFWI